MLTEGVDPAIIPDFARDTCGVSLDLGIAKDVAHGAGGVTAAITSLSRAVS